MNWLYNTFVYVVWFVATYYVVLFALLLIVGRKKIYEKNKKFTGTPKVSVIIPAYNEEQDIKDTIQSLKKINYKAVEFIFINDGSSDKTSEIITKHIKGLPRFRFIDNKTNKGKAACLNQGIKESRGEYVACMDADSMIEPDILEKTLPYFNDHKTGAVTVTVKVVNNKKFLHKLVDLEFILGLSLFLKISSFLNCVYVTPGPFSIYRKKVLEEIGGFDIDNITEDLEIAYRIHKHGYKIDNCAEAQVLTTVPENFKSLYVQRRRWYSGALQTLTKHKGMLLKRKHGFFAYMIPFNYTLIMLGLTLFLVSTYMGMSKLIENILYFQHTNFNFWTQISQFELDILAFGNVSFIGTSSLIMGIVLLILGLKISKTSLRTKKWGIIGFPLMYIIYQIFWIGSIASFIRGKKVKWR